MHTRPLDFLDVLVLHREHEPCMCTHMMHAQCDVTNANLVVMTSLAFAFHSCHVGIRWHDVIGVHVA